MAVTILGFAGAAGVVVLVGPRMALVADRLGDVTGMGGALFGALFLALATDLPEIALTISAVLTGSPRIAVGGLLGSTAAQLALIAVVDIALRKRQLYRDVALQTTLGHCALMASVLTVPLLFTAANPSVAGISAGTVLLLAAYLGGLLAIRGIGPHMQDVPGPESPSEDIEHTDDDEVREAAWPLWRRFGGFALALAGAGIALERTTERLGAELGLGETASGALLAGAVSSMPELVTAVSAARSGALELAVGNIVGSSALDVVLLTLADVFYTGSVFDLLGPPEVTLIAVALGLTVLLLVGMARRESRGPARVGPESYLMIALYVGGVLLLIAAGE